MILPEYLETVFIGTPPVAGWPSTFHMITAWNPKQIVSEPQNHAADTRLRTQLEQEQIVHFRITGGSADLEHQEASWAITGITLDRAIEIGRQYGQNAIFEVLDSEAFVVSCDTLERQSIGKFQQRLLASSNLQKPAQKRSTSPEEEQKILGYDPTKPETEEGSERLEAIRRLRARRMYLAGAGQLKGSATLQTSMPTAEGLLSASKPLTSEPT